jgi:UDP-2-acetamido-2,6-beta-L-arabino-hexul-4-ose reductase
MKVIVTGSDGFIGKNLTVALESEGHKVLSYTRKNTFEDLRKHVREAEFVFHLAGVNRPEKEEEFMEGNRDLTKKMLQLFREERRQIPVVLSSSIQADLDNPYGKSKRAAEEEVLNYQNDTGAAVTIYRLPNVFGKWAKPNYNSVTATFCHLISRNEPIQIHNPDIFLELVYIDDVIMEFMNVFYSEMKKNYAEVPVTYQVKLGEMADMLYSFQKSRIDRSVPNTEDGLYKKLYSTYLSYLPEDEFIYDLKMNEDNRGSFTEFLKTADRGQVSINVSRPGITKGNHWHHTKNEKFLVVSGEGVIRFRKVGEEKVLEYFVSGKKLQVVDIPVGYTHNIENLGKTNMVTVMWANEKLDLNRPDTYYLEV